MTAQTQQRRCQKSFGALTIVGLALATGCSSGEPDAEEVADDLSNEGTVTISWYGSDARNAAVQEVVDAFGEEYDDVEIETQPTTFDNHWDRVSVQATANDLPCVVAMQSRYQERYEDRGSLISLDDLIETGMIDVSGIPEDLLESQRSEDGNIYTIPYGIWFEGVTLNAPGIESHGATVPDELGTWDEYVDWASGAQDSMPEDAFAISDRGDQITQFQAFAISRGEDLFDGESVGFSEETLVEWFEMWADAAEEGLAPPPELLSEYSGVPESEGLMAEGRIMVSSTGDNNISDTQIGLEFNDAGDVSIYPSPTGDNPQVVGSNSWGISENCTNERDSASFIDYFINSTEGAYTLEAQTGLPVVTSILDEMIDDPEIDELIRQRMELYSEVAEEGALIDVWPDGTQQLVDQLGDSYQEVAFGQTSPEQAAEDFIAQAESGLSGF